jgi:O-antigen/teichoic acid export membrane protein
LSRKSSFLRGVSASWVATFITVAYSVASVPVALRYLSVEEFGLWMLVIQVAGYLSLLEFGMTAAAARILIDHKDDKSEGSYGATILTSALFFLCLSVLIVAAGLFLAAPVIKLFAVPANLETVAVHLLKWQACATAITVACRIFGSILYANQRIDLLMLVGAVFQIISLLIVWAILWQGGGLWELPWAAVATAILSSVTLALGCLAAGLIPKRGQWQGPTLRQFGCIAKLGKDIFLVNVGTQFLEASQLMIVSRTMGVGAAAIWAVCAKIFTLVFQLLTKIEGTAIVYFSEMMVRGERAKLVTRFRDVYQTTAGIAAVSVVAAATINTNFVTVWAGEKLLWPQINNILLAALVYINCVLRCHTDIILVSKEIQGYRYVNFVEGTAFIVLSLWTATTAGFPGILISALACALLLRGTYSLWRSSRYFDIPLGTFVFPWLSRSLLAAMVLIPFAAAGSLLAALTADPWVALAISLLWSGSFSLLILITVGIPKQIRTEIQSYLSQTILRHAGT